MAGTTFKFIGTNYASGVPVHELIVEGTVPASSIVDASQAVGEGKVTQHRLYSAIVTEEQLGKVIREGMYVSNEARADTLAHNHRKYLRTIHDGLLFEIEREQFEPECNPRIEIKTHGVWLPTQKLTETGWVPILEERI